jgi:uncharacterized RmlC-like cupin family protein
MAAPADYARGMDRESNWRTDGVRVVPADALDANTAQTPGMSRATAVNRARTGSAKLWAGTVVVHPGARTAAHHHGELESVIYVVRGLARIRWGENLEFVDEAGPGGFIYVPPFVPHQEINGLGDQPLECVVTRSGQDPIVVNLTIQGVEEPERVLWVDPGHPAPETMPASSVAGRTTR